jgi:hypothetical protein
LPFSEEFDEFVDPSEEGFPRVRAVAVRSRGWKARVVTAGQPAETIFGGIIRQLVWPILERDPCIALTLQEMYAPEGWEILSLDMSNATDYAPFWLARYLWGPLCQITGIEYLEPIIRSLGPHVVDDSFVTQRGWLMGSPLTWFTLNLVHRFLAARAGYSVFWILGDDFLAAGPFARRYVSLLESFSFKVNVPKSYLSVDYGFFAEKVYRRKGPDLVRLRDIPLTVLKGWAQLDKVGLQACALPRKKRKVLAAFSLSFWAKPLRRLRGVPKCLLREFGGLGAPSFRGWRGMLTGGELQIGNGLFCKAFCPYSSRFPELQDSFLKSSRVARPLKEVMLPYVAYQKMRDPQPERFPNPVKEWEAFRRRVSHLWHPRPLNPAKWTVERIREWRRAAEDEKFVYANRPSFLDFEP